MCRQRSREGSSKVCRVEELITMEGGGGGVKNREKELRGNGLF